jgi:hypothetical protein
MRPPFRAHSEESRQKKCPDKRAGMKGIRWIAVTAKEMAEASREQTPFPAGAMIPLLQVGINVETPAPATAQYNLQVDFDHNEAAGPALT